MKRMFNKVYFSNNDSRVKFFNESVGLDQPFIFDTKDVEKMVNSQDLGKDLSFKNLFKVTVKGDDLHELVENVYGQETFPVSKSIINMINYIEVYIDIQFYLEGGAAFEFAGEFDGETFTNDCLWIHHGSNYKIKHYNCYFKDDEYMNYLDTQGNKNLDKIIEEAIYTENNIIWSYIVLDELKITITSTETE